MPIAVAVLLGLAGLFIVIYPLLGVDAATEGEDYGTLIHDGEQEASAKQVLRDVDFDRRLGNLDDDDYHELRDRFEESALEAMKSRYDRERELDFAIDRQLHTLSAERPSPNGSEKSAKTTSRTTARPAKSATTPTHSTSGSSGSSGSSSTSNTPSSPSADAADRRAALRKRRGV